MVLFGWLCFCWGFLFVWVCCGAVCLGFGWVFVWEFFLLVGLVGFLAREMSGSKGGCVELIKILTLRRFSSVI